MTITSPPLTPQDIGASPLNRVQSSRDGYLFSPFIDFVCLGGGSLLLFIPMMFLDVATFEPAVAATILFLAHFINSPHFAHSYQIFYRNFPEKAFGDTYSRQLRARYIVAGIVAPVMLIAFFAVAFAMENARVLGFSLNIMLFFVGWHYVKQGYGMIIVDSVLKQNFFADREKTILTINAYFCWILSWAALNNSIAHHNLFGLTAYSIPVPEPVLLLIGIATAATSVLALTVIARRRYTDKPFPFNGTVAYFVTLYLWVLFPALVAPAAFVVLMVLATPAAHSLQYLVVVWRYQLNVERDKAQPKQGRSLFAKPGSKLVYFFIFGVVIAFFGFWILPTALDKLIFYNRAIFGSQMFLFMLAIFINVHHYFLDNVMWRRENPDVAKYLFHTN